MMPPGRGLYGPQGHSYTQNMKALGLVVSEKLDPTGMVDRIYEEDHYTLLQTKYQRTNGPVNAHLRPEI